MGDVDGVLNVNYWAGHFFAYQSRSSSSYHEFTVGSNYASGNNTFGISNTNTSGTTWTYKLNGSAVATVTLPFSKADHINGGIETNDTSAYFNSGMVDQHLQWTDSNGWHYCTSSDISSSNNHVRSSFNSWNSVFNGSNFPNTITFTR